MTQRATHLLHQENIRTVERTSENIIEDSQEHQRRTVENTVRTSKSSPVETKSEKKNNYKNPKNLQKLKSKNK